MKKYDFESVMSREGLSSIKTDGGIIKSMLGLNYYDDTISMWVADMDFATAPEIIDAIKKRTDQLLLGYTKTNDAYFESIINWYNKRHKMKFNKESIVFSNGTVSAIRNAIRAFTSEGDGIVIQPPVYFPFEGSIKSTGRTVLYNTIIKNENNVYHIDFEGFEKLCEDENTKMFIFCNPHNPIGQIWSKEDSQKLLDIAHANNVLVFSDEIHADLIRKNGQFTSLLNLENNENVVVATALNKTFNVAGLHMTNLIIENEELRNTFNAYTGWVGMSPLVLEATIAAYNQGEEWVTALNEVIDNNLYIMKQFIDDKLPDVKFEIPAGTYLAWLDFNAYNISEKELLEKLADDGHLILEGGSMFGKTSEKFLRLNVACPEKVLVEALARLEGVVKKIEKLK